MRTGRRYQWGRELPVQIYFRQGDFIVIRMVYQSYRSRDAISAEW
jgi:hypothetical protein